MNGVTGRPRDVLAVTFSDRPVGTDHSLRNLCSAWSDDDVRLTLAGPRDSELHAWWKDAGLPFIGLDLPSTSARRAGHRLANLPDHSSALVFRAASQVARLAPGYDVLHSNWLLSHPAVVLAARRSGVPALLELHDILPSRAGRAVLNATIGGARRSVAVSDAVRAQLSPRARRRTETVHQGVDTDRFAPGIPDLRRRAALSGGRTESVLVAIIGRFDPQKRLEVAIDAVAEVRSRGHDVRLALIGEASEDNGDYETALRSRAAAKLPGAHTFSPAVHDVEVILRSVDVVIVPSANEPFGLIAAEAQACEVPVVVSDTGGLPEFVVDGVTGAVVPHTEAAAFAAALTSMTDPSVRARLGTAGRRNIQEHFGIRRRADRFRAVYGELATARR